MKKKLTLNLIVTAAFFLISVLWLKLAIDLPHSSSVTTFAGPATFPLLILSIMCVISGFLLIGELRALRAGTLPGETMSRDDFRRVIALLIVALAYVFLLDVIGYLPSTMLLILAALFLFGQRNKKVFVSVSILFPLLIYLVFKQILKIQLP